MKESTRDSLKEEILQSSKTCKENLEKLLDEETNRYNWDILWSLVCYCDVIQKIMKDFPKGVSK